MIFTECECGEPIMVNYECGDPRGYSRVNCKCGKIAMVERISFDGETTILGTEEELNEFLKEKGLRHSK